MQQQPWLEHKPLCPPLSPEGGARMAGDMPISQPRKLERGEGAAPVPHPVPGTTSLTKATQGRTLRDTAWHGGRDDWERVRWLVRYTCSQEEARDKCCCSARFLLFVQPRTLAHGIRVGSLSSLHLSGNALPNTNPGLCLLGYLKSSQVDSEKSPSL